MKRTPTLCHQLAGIKFLLATLSVFAMTCLTVTASAQDGPQRERGRRGGPGGGGPGGGPGGGGFGGPGGGGFGGPGGRQGGGGMRGRMGGDPTIGLLRVEEVRDELEITPEQNEAIQKMAEANRPERPENVNFREMSEEERNEFFDKMRKKQGELNAKAKEQLEEVLLPQQLDRLSQIAIQQQGVQALGRPDVAEELGITDEQKKELESKREEIQRTMRERMQELLASGDREGMREKMGEVRKEIDEKILGVLDSDQRKKFDEMKGEPFEMPERSFGGRGGRGRGGEGGQGRGRGGDGGGRPSAEE